MWFLVFFFKQKTAYEMRISDWSSDVCSSDFESAVRDRPLHHPPAHREGGRAGVDPGFLHLLAVLPLYHLQGHVPRRAALLVLSRPAGRPLLVQLRGVPPALLDQHLPDQIGRASCRERVCPYV